MAKELKRFNGRAYCCHKPGDPNWDGVQPGSSRIYGAAASRADLRRLIEEYTGTAPSTRELSVYWVDTWGYNMEHIIPERGLWLRQGSTGPIVRLI